MVRRSRPHSSPSPPIFAQIAKVVFVLSSLPSFLFEDNSENSFRRPICPIGIALWSRTERRFSHIERRRVRLSEREGERAHARTHAPASDRFVSSWLSLDVTQTTRLASARHAWRGADTATDVTFASPCLFYSHVGRSSVCRATEGRRSAQSCS